MKLQSCVLARARRLSALRCRHAGHHLHVELRSIKIDARPGEVVNRDFKLHLAATGSQVHFKSRAEDWWASEDGSQSFYRRAGTLPRSLRPLDLPEPRRDRRCARWRPQYPGDRGHPRGMPGPAATGASSPSTRFPTRSTIRREWRSISKPPSRWESSSTWRPSCATPKSARSRSPKARRVSRCAPAGNTPVGAEGRVEFLPLGGPRSGQASPVATAIVPRATVLLDPAPCRILKTRASQLFPRCPRAATSSG